MDKEIGLIAQRPRAHIRPRHARQVKREPSRLKATAPGLRDLKVETRAIGTLKPNPHNARTHSKKQLRQIAASIEEFGFTNPVLIDAKGRIIAGHGRVEAAKLLGLITVPTICIDDLTEAQKRAYVIADNRLAEIAGWDEELLAVELQYLIELEIDFDVEITGFETVEIDLLIKSVEASDAADGGDAIPEVDNDHPPVSQIGDIWLLGPHRLLCGDALEPSSYETLMGGAKAEVAFTDPPYNVAIDRHVCGSGRIKHADFVMASGELSEAEFIAFHVKALSNVAAHSVGGSIHFVCTDWRHIYELITAGRLVYSELKNVCVWAKTNGGMGSFYRSQHELVCVFKNGTAPHINNVQLGKYGRNRTNLWTYEGVNTLNPDRRDELHMHPTVKPVAMVADAIKDCSKRRGIVLDCFVGSGTTIIAAEKTGRIAYAMELDPKYVDTAVLRWEGFVRTDAVHAETHLTFKELTERRRK